jgi:uncharacterized membrane protein
MRMESRARLLGHPIHPMLIVFPLGLLATSLAFDIVHWARSNDTFFAHMALWLIGIGVCTGLFAAIFGFVDWLAIPKGTRAKSVGLWHGLGNVVVVGLFIVSWVLRVAGDPLHPPGAAFVLDIIAVLLALVTGWLGGELVDRLGIGVSPNANPDAPSSLKTETPAPSRSRSLGASEARV